MKDPKALFPFLFASSWLGDLVLTILAFFLAFTHDGPLTPLVFLTVGICILTGNLLPIASYWIFTRWRADELRAEGAEASVRVREALKRSEEVMGRLDEAEGALSKAILVARQLPERIAESYRSVEELTDKLDTLEIDSFTETLQGNTTLLTDLQKESQAIRKTIDSLNSGLSEVPASVGKLVKASLAKAKPEQPDENDVSLAERIDLVFESLESVQDSLDGLLARMAELPKAETKAHQELPEIAEEPEMSDEPEVADDPEPEEESGEDDGGGEALVVDDEEAAEDAVEESEEEVIEEPDEVLEIIDESEPEPEPEPESDMPEQGEMDLDEPAAAAPGRTVARDTVKLSAHAMVGISNKLYIRGDEPWLSWDEGQQMELVGIGEFAWKMDNLKEPIEVAVFLNDETPADGGNIVLEPGKPVDIRPTFPKS